MVRCGDAWLLDRKAGLCSPLSVIFLTLRTADTRSLKYENCKDLQTFRTASFYGAFHILGPLAAELFCLFVGSPLQWVPERTQGNCWRRRHSSRRPRLCQSAHGLYRFIKWSWHQRTGQGAISFWPSIVHSRGNTDVTLQWALAGARGGGWGSEHFAFLKRNINLYTAIYTYLNINPCPVRMQACENKTCDILNETIDDWLVCVCVCITNFNYVTKDTDFF
jgi:hypothetical protein